MEVVVNGRTGYNSSLMLRFGAASTLRLPLRPALSRIFQWSVPSVAFSSRLARPSQPAAGMLVPVRKHLRRLGRSQNPSPQDPTEFSDTR